MRTDRYTDRHDMANSRNVSAIWSSLGRVCIACKITRGKGSESIAVSFWLDHNGSNKPSRHKSDEAIFAILQACRKMLCSVIEI
jgi:hypothetical protein